MAQNYDILQNRQNWQAAAASLGENQQGILPGGWSPPAYTPGKQTDPHGLPQYIPGQEPPDLTDPYYRTLMYQVNPDGSLSYGYPGFTLAPGQKAVDNRGVMFENPGTEALHVGLRQQNPSAPQPGESGYNSGDMPVGTNLGGNAVQAEKYPVTVKTGRVLDPALARALAQRSEMITGRKAQSYDVDRDAGGNPRDPNTYSYTPVGSWTTGGRPTGAPMSREQKIASERANSSYPEQFDKYMESGMNFKNQDIQDAIGRVGRSAVDSVWDANPGARDAANKYKQEHDARVAQMTADRTAMGMDPTKAPYINGNVPKFGSGQTGYTEIGGGPLSSSPGTPPPATPPPTTPPPTTPPPATPPPTGLPGGVPDVGNNGPTGMPQIPNMAAASVPSGPAASISSASGNRLSPGPTSSWLQILMQQDPEMGNYLRSIGSA
jgi:hypothetical protein